ncbi:hypothetical protein EW15_1563 [Prochlorococcus sp. MIT 0801]|nr:hypothetical protein EW15_1563 [Prochlorococcus sp. MIT 0801]
MIFKKNISNLNGIHFEFNKKIALLVFLSYFLYITKSEIGKKFRNPSTSNLIT